MNIENVNPNIKYVYHYTEKKNITKIMNDKAIISKDKYVFFTTSLSDSITAFEQEMMVENKLYIDINGNIKKRKKCNKNDYCILKIPYQNDNEFYRFRFNNQSPKSIYSISISHKGAYHFKDAKVIEFPSSSKILKVFTKTAIAAATASILLLPHNTFAANWLDANNYDTSWYYSNLSATSYSISTAKQMAGLAHLVNNENVTFAGKSISVISDVDLTANNWETIKDIFEGNICGGHRFILNCLDGALIENKNISNTFYSYKICKDSSNFTSIYVPAPYTVAKLKELSGGKDVFLNNKKLSDDVNLRSLNLTETDVFDVFTVKYITIEDTVKGTKIPFRFESGDAIDNVKNAYYNKTNIPVDKLIIKYNNKELSDGRTLADYNIQMNSTLNVYVKAKVNMVAKYNENVIESKDINAISGDTVKITFDLKDIYEIEKVLVNEIDKTNEVVNNELNINCSGDDINIKASYKLKNNEPSTSTEDNKDDKDKDKDKNKDNKDSNNDNNNSSDNNNNSESSKDNNQGTDKKDTNTKSTIPTDKTKNQNTKNQTEQLKNPQTGDNIVVYLTTFFASLIGIIISIFKKKA